MPHRQLLLLAVLNVGPYFIGNSLLPLLPLHFGELGAPVADSGLYLSLIFAALMFGSLAGGWLSSHTNRRKPVLTTATTVSIGALLLLTQATSLSALLLLTMLIWLAGGLTITSVTILAGLHAPPNQRGRVFGTIGVTVGLTQFAGGMIAGPVVEQASFTDLFLLVAALQIAPLIASFLVDDSVKATAPQPSTTGRRSLSPGYWLLLVATFLVYVVNFSIVLGRPLAMHEAGFDAAAISSTGAVAGLVGLPLPFAMGWLSDRMGRRSLLALGWVLFASGMLLLAFAQSLIAYWLSAVLMAGMMSTISLASALVADLVRHSYLSSALSRLSAIPWLGAIVGSSLAGALFVVLGLRATFFLVGLMPLLSAALVIGLRQPSPGSLDSVEVASATS